MLQEFARQRGESGQQETVIETADSGDCGSHRRDAM